MGTYDPTFVERTLAANGFRMPDVAVETGTCLGYSTRILSERFSCVHTIELSEWLYDRAIRNFPDQGMRNVRCWFGDSAQVLKLLIEEELDLRRPALFYLDAHWSGDRTVDWGSSEWQGYFERGQRVNTAHRGWSNRPSSEQQVPLAEELKLIVERFPYEAVVYVDDMNRFDAEGKGRKGGGFVGNDWSHLELDTLRKIVEPRRKGWHVSEDGEQLVILLGESHHVPAKVEKL